MSDVPNQLDAVPEDIPGAPILKSTGLFPRTRWSLVRRAAIAHTALGDWLGCYWYPLYAWARKRGASPEEAADGVQGFLARLCSNNLLAQADESRGRLRSWLLTSFLNYLAGKYTKTETLKRSVDIFSVGIDWDSVESAYSADAIHATSPDHVYARTWALTLMDEALDRVSDHYEKTGRRALFEALLPALESPLEDATYEQLAPPLGVTGAALRQAAVRVRQRYRRTLLDLASARLGITSEVLLGRELRELLCK